MPPLRGFGYLRRASRRRLQKSGDTKETVDILGAGGHQDPGARLSAQHLTLQALTENTWAWSFKVVLSHSRTPREA